MDTDSIIREIKNSMTGDPKKDDENSAEINR